MFEGVYAMPIRVLDPRVAAQIAAGEVVERPASIVKELVENALDAGAGRISISIRGGGIDEIVIQDDGGGIPEDELELAFERHATSKLASADDLWAIHTLGFRGEALPSIAAIAQVTCFSRVPGAPLGAELRIAGGEVQGIGARSGSPGTTFTIRNLFFNIPVRRAFLKSPAAEATAIAAVVTQYALAYPHVAFTLVRDGKRIVQTSGRGQLPDVLLELYGVEVARQMLPVEARAGEDIGAVRVQGMVSAPTINRGGRDGMKLTVNGRAIAARGAISTMIEEAYHTLLMKGRFPIVVLRIDVHPAAVDVNVHPTKSEVKFRNPELVSRTLERAVRAAVQEAVVIQGWAAEPPQSGGEPVDEPALDDEVASSIAQEIPAVTAPPSQPPRAPATPRLAEDEDWLSEWDRLADTTPVQAALLGREQAYAPPYEPAQPRRLAEARWPEPTAPRASDDQADYADQPALAAMPASDPAPAWANAPANAPAAPAAERIAPRLPALRALAQLAQTYLLTEGPDGALYLIDQHAAHERITYERLLAQHAAGALQAQTLLLPQQVVLPPAVQQALLGAEAELAAWGFALSEAEGGVEVQAVPAGLALEELANTLSDLGSHLSGSGGRTPDARRDATLATLACHTSVRAGQSLSPVEQQALIDQLAGCEGPRTCPHGRPTLMVLTRHQLELQFGRLGA
jgi:DNA mismatch repair protein MutL